MPITSPPRATIIISVYKDTEALAVILYALQQQSTEDFSILVSEDGNSSEMAQFIARQDPRLQLLHLTQEDDGFRKNRALNRAILTAPDDYLIFIDGDCVPHKNFVQAHTGYAEHGVANCGRRIELGEKYSAMLRHDPSSIRQLGGNLNYLLRYPSLSQDHTKNIELGFYLPLFQLLQHNRNSSIVGCNFSLYRNDLLAINGFDEAYHSPGIGEDSDLELRLRNNGIRMKSNKLVAIQYHLHHPRGYCVSKENFDLLRQATRNTATRCAQGIDAHLE